MSRPETPDLMKRRGCDAVGGCDGRLSTLAWRSGRCQRNLE
jgi:hypothetical protein